MKRVFLLSLLISLLLATNLFADCTTTVSGIIDGETWTKAGSPYCFDGNVIVKNLTITEGVRIEFCGTCELRVEGIEAKLDATGTAQDPIIFTSAAGAPGWKGIILDNTSASKLIHCQIEKSSNRGLTILNCAPTVQDCTITNNSVTGEGGGLYVLLDTSADELHLKNCRINNNDSTSHGGGIYALLSSGSLILKDCEINSNSSNYLFSNGNFYGGGLYVESAAGGLCLIDCEISDNYSYSRCSGTNCRSYGRGGGIFISSGNVSCIRSVINSNSATASCSGSGCRGYAQGGGVYPYSGALKLTNCIISHNALSASAGYEYGGGIFTYNATVAIQNCTIAYNQNEGIYNSSGIVEVINSIVYNNAGTQIAGTATVTYSDVEDCYEGEGNICEDPLFESILNLRIRCDYSPCVDVGSERPWYNDICFPPSCKTERNDMGAHGGPEAAKICPCPGVCLGDFDNDGDVDGSDLAIFAGDFGRTDCPVVLNIYKWKCN